MQKIKIIMGKAAHQVESVNSSRHCVGVMKFYNCKNPNHCILGSKSIEALPVHHCFITVAIQ